MIPRHLPRFIRSLAPPTPRRERHVCPCCGAPHLPPAGRKPGWCWFCYTIRDEAVRLEREDPDAGRGAPLTH